MATRKLSVPLSEKTYEELSIASRDAGRTKAAYVRQLIEKTIGVYNPNDYLKTKCDIRITISKGKLEKIKERADKCNKSIPEYLSDVAAGELPDAVSVTVNDLYFMALRLSELTEDVKVICKELRHTGAIDCDDITRIKQNLTIINRLFETGFKNELSDRNKICREVKREILRKAFRKNGSTKS